MNRKFSLLIRYCTWLLIGFSCIMMSSHSPRIGEAIDHYNLVPVYYNGQNYRNVEGRNTTADGYNLGLRYQCVEFVKRYYHDRYNHKMPYAGGNAKDFFDANLEDVGFNAKRGLMQYRNVRNEKPLPGDIIVYGARPGNPFGHVGIVTQVTDDSVEFIQQNVGKKTRETLRLVEYQGIYTVVDYDILGWLRYVTP